MIQGDKLKGSVIGGWMVNYLNNTRQDIVPLVRINLELNGEGY